MDKLLLTAFLTALAGFITFVLSIVKLVNEKESTTTGYRQAWTDSVRSCLASLIGKLNSTAAMVASHKNNIDLRNELFGKEEGTADDDHKRVKDYIESNMKATVEARRALKKETYEAYALARLHFKPNDISFSRVEHKFDAAMSLIEQLEVEDEKSNRSALKEKIHAEVSEITGYCRDILKTEWETVKRGEPTYQITKQYSIYGGIGTLTVLLLIGVYAAISAIRGDRFSFAPTAERTHGAVALGASDRLIEQRRASEAYMNCSSIEVNVSTSGERKPPAKERSSPQRAKCERVIDNNVPPPN